MQTGIIGLPQVGKTTLFRILTKAHLDAKSVAAPTHVGVAKVPEPRLDKIAPLFKPKKVTHAAVQYVDVGGLHVDRSAVAHDKDRSAVAHDKDRSAVAQNKIHARDAALLAPLRDVDALAHVLRVFEDPAVPHSSGSIDPLRDATNLDLELLFADHDQVVRRIERIDKDLKKKKEPALEHERAVLLQCRAALEAEKPLRELELKPEDAKLISGFKFLSRLPMLYVLNLGDEEAAEIHSAVDRHKLSSLTARPNSAVVAVCGRLEAELAEMDEREAAELLSSYGFQESGLDRLIHATYRLLGLISFFTVGEPEARAWTIPRGTTALKAAGEIHSDLERGFIRAEVVRWDDLLAAGRWAAARERGKIRLEGKEYVVQDGDVLLFRHSG